MKSFLKIIPLLLFCLMLLGCGSVEPPAPECEHNWSEARCTFPKTCWNCNATMGEYGDHDFRAATCTNPPSCYYCNIIEGEPLGHDFRDATCINPKTCKKCKLTEGEALGHEYAPATCTDDQSCIRCKHPGEEKATGHKYAKTTCTVCEDKVTITTYDELNKFLSEHHNVITTSVGKVEVGFEIKVHDPVLFENCDFELRIKSSLYCKELKTSMRNIIGTNNAFSYEERKQALIDILDYEMNIISIAEEAFSGKKFSVYFFESGYEYPAIQVGYTSTTYFPFRNWETNGSGKVGYVGTDLCDWKMNEYWGDCFIRCTQTYSAKPCGLHDDVKAARPEYDLHFYGYLE